jgi:hypothetical protein
LRIFGEEGLSHREGTTSKVERGMLTRGENTSHMENDLGFEDFKLRKNIFMEGLQQNFSYERQS